MFHVSAENETRIAGPRPLKLTPSRSTAWARTLVGNAAFTLYVFLLCGAFHPNSDSRPSSSTLEAALWVLGFAISVIGLWMRRSTFVASLKASVPALVFVGYLVLSSAWSDDPGISFKRAFELLETSLTAYFIVASYDYRTFLEKLTLAFTIVAAVCALDIVVFPTIGIMQEEYKGAWRGVFIHKNLLGQAMVVAISSMTIRMSGLLRFSRIWWRCTAALVLFALLLVGSQSATSVGIVAVLLLFLYKTRLSFFRNTAAVARGLSIALALALIFVPFEWKDIFAIFGRDTTLTGRTDIWGPVMQQITTRPWLGFGYDSFWLPDDAGSSHFNIPLNWIPSHAHNGLLELALDGGLVAIALFFVMYVNAVTRCWNFLQRKKSVAYAFPVTICIYLILANITEANIAKFGEVNWGMFLSAMLYAGRLRQPDAELTEPGISIRRGIRLNNLVQR